MCQIRYIIHVKTFPVANEWSALKHQCGSTIFIVEFEYVFAH